MDILHFFLPFFFGWSLSHPGFLLSCLIHNHFYTNVPIFFIRHTHLPNNPFTRPLFINKSHVYMFFHIHHTQHTTTQRIYMLIFPLLPLTTPPPPLSLIHSFVYIYMSFESFYSRSLSLSLSLSRFSDTAVNLFLSPLCIQVNSL